MMTFKIGTIFVLKSINKKKIDVKVNMPYAVNN